jgi:hypothetical protein
MIPRILRLFRAHRILESEYERLRAENRRLLRRVHSVIRERDMASAMANEMKLLMEHAEARAEESAQHLDQARLSEITATRQVADLHAFRFFGRGIYNRPESEVPQIEPERRPIEKHRQQAADIVEQKRQQYIKDVQEFNRRQGLSPVSTEDAGKFFDEELKQTAAG